MKLKACKIRLGSNFYSPCSGLWDFQPIASFVSFCPGWLLHLYNLLSSTLQDCWGQRWGLHNLELETITKAQGHCRGAGLHHCEDMTERPCGKLLSGFPWTLNPILFSCFFFLLDVYWEKPALAGAYLLILVHSGFLRLAAPAYENTIRPTALCSNKSSLPLVKSPASAAIVFFREWKEQFLCPEC